MSLPQAKPLPASFAGGRYRVTGLLGGGKVELLERPADDWFAQVLGAVRRLQPAQQGR